MTTDGLTYDTGALIAAERDDRLMWAMHCAASGRGLLPTVPCGVLAAVWSGGPQHQLSRLLRGCKVEELSEEQARQVGGLIARSGLDDTVELAVAEGALRRNDAVVTSDRTHITQVADAVGERIAMHDVWRPAGDLENSQPQHRSDERAACTLEQSLGSFADSAQLYDGLLARSGEELIWSSSTATCSDSIGAASAALTPGHASADAWPTPGLVTSHDTGRGGSESRCSRRCCR